MNMKRFVSDRSSHRGFTLAELLIVIAIIGLLVTMTVLVGRSVVGKGKIDQAQQIMLVLDQALSEYQAETGSIPAFREDDYNPPTGVPGRERDIRKEVAVFIGQAKGYSTIDKMLGAIDSQFLVKRNAIYADLIDHAYAGTISVDDDRPSVRDPWGMEILYIHPHRDNEDAFELLGRPVNDRPYFVSAGPDLLYHTIEDNIYSYEAVDRSNVDNGG